MFLSCVLCIPVQILNIIEMPNVKSERGGAERRILVPGCDGVGGSAGEPRLCLCVCVCVCLFRVGRGLLVLPRTK